MNSQCSLHQLDRDAWVYLTSKFADYNYRQSWAFGEASAYRVGASSEHIAIEYPGRGVVALADVRIRKVPLFGGGIAYVAGGPMVWNKSDYQVDILSAVVDSLTKEYVHRRHLTLRVAPPIRLQMLEEPLKAALVNSGFSPLSSGATIVLDLFPDESEIRKQFHQKWRNCLNKSERAGLSVRSGHDLSMFQEFSPLFKGLMAEKNFLVDLDIKFYEQVQKNAADKDKFRITLADYQGRTVAGHVASILGDTSVYLLGAADKTGRAVNAAYLLQWKAIQIAKAANCRWYDLGGIDPVNNPGVFNFKKRMGGYETPLPEPYQLHPNGLRAFLIRLGERMFTKLKPLLVHS